MFRFVLVPFLFDNVLASVFCFRCRFPRMWQLCGVVVSFRQFVLFSFIFFCFGISILFRTRCNQKHRLGQTLLKDFEESAAVYGLRIHLGKTKVMTWDSLSRGCFSIKVGFNEVQVLSEFVGEKYLGRIALVFFMLL